MKTFWTNFGVIAVLGLIAWKTSSSPIEIIGAISGLLCVWLVAKENIWNFPIAIINVGAFFYMFYDAKLYADMTLQVFFLILTVYGWVIWLTKRGNNKVRPTRSITNNEIIILTAITVIGTWFWGSWLAGHTDASIPFLDSFIAVVSIIAQYLLSKKVLQNWSLWILVDVLSIGMYSYKGLYLTSGLYAVFLLIAIGGLISWKKNMQKDQYIFGIDVAVHKNTAN